MSAKLGKLCTSHVKVSVNLQSYEQRSTSPRNHEYYLYVYLNSLNLAPKTQKKDQFAAKARVIIIWRLYICVMKWKLHCTKGKGLTK